MPDSWEFPWFAAWDLAFQVVPLAIVDAEFAKSQLSKLTREWYMHPNGQLPAYEWSFSRCESARPCVGGVPGLRDRSPDERAWRTTRFLERVFQKLLMNFTWWVNRRDFKGDNVFSGGFLDSTTSGCSTGARGCPPAAI